MLQRGDPINSIVVGEGEDGNPLKETNMDILQNITANEQSQNEFHEHHKTCRKGFNGRDGCHLAKKSGSCSGTHCALLHPILEEENYDDMVDDEESDDYSKDSSDCDGSLDSDETNFVENRLPSDYYVKQKSKTQIGQKCKYPYNVVDLFSTKTELSIRNPL